MTSYSFRKSAFSKEQVFSLRETALYVEEVNAQPVKIPYMDIKAIRLSFMPDRMRTNNYQCTVETARGNFSFMTSSFVSLANFRTDNIGYKNFVTELIAKTYAINPTVSLLSGRPKTAYRLSIILMTAAFLAVAILIYYLGDYMSSISWVKFVLILLLIPMAFSYIMKNKPGVFTADNIPQKLLPG